MEVKNRKQLDRKLLKENLQSLWVDGILVLDEEGKKVCEYSMDCLLYTSQVRQQAGLHHKHRCTGQYPSVVAGH